MKYSRTTKGFYPKGFKGDVPVDAEDISMKDYRDLLEGESQGQIIDWSTTPPSLKEAPPPPLTPELTTEEKLAMIGLTLPELAEALGLS